MNPSNIEPYVAPYVQVRHAIHLLYATSPRRDSDLLGAAFNLRFDKTGNRLPLELHGCGCSLCARSQRSGLHLLQSPPPERWRGK